MTGVVDTIPPTFNNCPSDITQDVSAGTTQTAVTWTPPTASDNVTPTNMLNILATHMPGDNFDVGSTQVSYIVTDGAGLTSTCSFNVIVQSEWCYQSKPVVLS